MTKTVTLHVRLLIAGSEVEAAVSVPADPSPRRVLLPVLQNLTEAVVQIAAQASAASISCKKGCDACCRQMVPISPAEAYALAALLETLPPARAAEILARFDQARDQLERAGLLDRLAQRHSLSAPEQQQLDRDYFAAQVPCPFLEDHACSIHAARPLACREFLVTSPPEYCRHPTADRVTPVPLPAKVSLALAAHDSQPWLPLVLARDFVAQNPEPLPADLPPVLLQKILTSLQS